MAAFNFTMTDEDKMALARAACVKQAPYFASAAYGFVFVSTEEIDTMAVSKNLVLLYNPRWVLGVKPEQLAGGIAHEINHFLRHHFLRALGVDDPELWNIAGDLAINPDLKRGGWELPPGVLYPDAFGLPEGKTTEEYYALLKQKGQGGGKEGQDPAKPEQSKGICAGQCGSMSGNPGAEGKEDELDKKYGKSEVEKKSLVTRIANDLATHIKNNGRGNIPGALCDLVQELLEPPHVRWQDELAQLLRDATGRLQSGGDDFSFARPSKRSIMRGIIRPGLVEHLPEVAIVRDSSGSMGGKQLTDVTREAYGVMQALGIDEVWFCDADVGAAMPWVRVGPDFFRNLSEVHGRGGTNFTPVIEEAMQLHPKPDLLVYGTDGDGSAPAAPPPGMEVVWCIVPSYYNRAPAKWGHTVFVSEDPNVRRRAVQQADEPDEDDDD